MKKSVSCLLIVIFAMTCVVVNEQQAAAEADYLNMSWDDIIAAAKEEGSLTFYAWWGEQFWKMAGEQFEQKYGIKTKIVIADGSATMDKILSEKNKEVGTIDAILIGGARVKVGMDAGVFYGPIQGIIPDADKLDPKLSKVQEGVETKGYLVPIYRNQTGLLYNPDRVSNPPQTWEDLVAWIKANPKQFSFCDPTKGGSGQAFVQMAINYLAGGLDKYYGDTELDPEKVKNWESVWNWMNEMEDLMTITGSNNESLTRLNEGEVSLAVAWDDDTFIALKKGTMMKQAKLYIPQMGLPGGGDSAGVIKNAKNKAAALLFIAYLIEPETQIQMNEILGSYLARTDVTGKEAFLTEEERQKYGVEWIPAAYKNHFNNEFVKNVLMK
ncbi:hypothetical protein U27_02394 [Candidatus Vecturithrix granuli]|uniref:Extracellular solute-binding protein family 1 n=1 Tax=Vecturithrix granuli TaxID=1499967 RepID=A0A0S6W7B2_VECG1|nr:hypothetical protein U27_02394 [Candidatus Vecturithrix granuli]